MTCALVRCKVLQFLSLIINRIIYQAKMQNELTEPGPLLLPSGKLAHIGWARQPLLDGNLSAAYFYPGRFMQAFRIKRWDYYAVFTPQHFFSATIADLGYAGNIFVYILNFSTGELHEEGLIIPFSKNIHLPQHPKSGDATFQDHRAALSFNRLPDHRVISISWPEFNQGRGINARIRLDFLPNHESMNIVIPIGSQRFYYNHKINCLPADGFLQYGDHLEEINPAESLGSLDWGRGVWEYSSFWNWASASGYLPDGRSMGLNLGTGFGDTSKATENCLILDGKLHKLQEVAFNYDQHNYSNPWNFTDSEGRIALDFTPFKERLARTNLLLIFSEVHQMFGRFSGWVKTDDDEKIEIKDLIGFAEEHHARW